MSGLTFNQYRELSAKFVQESVKGDHEYFYLGLVGEFGELCNYLKKEIRDGVDYSAEIKAEFGDVLWYVARLTTERDCITWAWARYTVQRSDYSDLSFDFLHALATGLSTRYSKALAILQKMFFKRFPDATTRDCIGLMQANLDKLTARYAPQPATIYEVNHIINDPDEDVMVSEITYLGVTHRAITVRRDRTLFGLMICDLKGHIIFKALKFNSQSIRENHDSLVNYVITAIGKHQQTSQTEGYSDDN